MKKNVPFLLLLGFCLLFYSAQAQVKGGSVGLGLQVGDPSGVTLKFYNANKASIDILAAWDLDDYFFINVHALYHKPLGSARNAHFFYGPGAFLAFREYDRFDDYLGVGISGNIGLGVFFDRFELYGQLTPRLQVIERTDGDLGGGIGLRFYF